MFSLSSVVAVVAGLASVATAIDYQSMTVFMYNIDRPDKVDIEICLHSEETPWKRCITPELDCGATPHKGDIWIEYDIPGLANPLEIHPGNFCHERGTDFDKWDNLWMRHGNQFMNAPEDCKHEAWILFDHATVKCNFNQFLLPFNSSAANDF